LFDDDDDRLSVTALVAAALDGDEAAWVELVDRHTPLVLSVLRRYRLSAADAEDVTQIVLLRLVEHLGDLREPRALPMWLITTTRNECIRLLRTGRALVPYDPTATRADVAADGPEPVDGVLRAEIGEAVLEALAELPERHRTLLLLLSQDPPLSYKEIAKRLGIPVGSIGPTRARALDKLRSSPALMALSGSEAPSAPTGGGSERYGITILERG
jgi:RNA polymerase sigma factor (sigma-70 family)